MTRFQIERPIARAAAVRLCAEIRGYNRLKPWTRNAIWCCICAKQAKGDSDRMCFSRRVDNRGCGQVNRRYAKKLRPFAACLAGRSMVECPR